MPNRTPAAVAALMLLVGCTTMAPGATVPVTPHSHYQVRTTR